MLRAEYTTQFKKDLKLARLRCHDLGAESKAPAWIVPDVLHRAPHAGGVTPPAKVASNRVGARSPSAPHSGGDAARQGYEQQGGARSPSAPHSGGDAARLGKVRLQDELPNCGNRPCKAACRARHAEVTDEGGTASPLLVRSENNDCNLEIFFQITEMGRDGGLAVHAGPRGRGPSQAAGGIGPTRSLDRVGTSPSTASGQASTGCPKAARRHAAFHSRASAVAGLGEAIHMNRYFLG